ncbi:MAG TPA: hypothetical protein VMT15_04995 [Bryobacteraceae bacterium]|nr:hypothetical protein [Bryobacteraceae bacterium]
MFQKSLVAAFLFTGFFGASAANAQPPRQCYTLASLQGNYEVVVNYGSNVAMALGTRSYDGNGNMTGTFLINAPTAGSTTGARTITSGTQTGTYTVNCNGTGQITRILTQTNGTVTTTLDDFVITGATVINGQLVATSVTDAAEVPSGIVAGGLFVTRVYTRLPDWYI